MATPEGRVKEKVKKVLNEQGIWWYMPVQTGWGVAGIPDFVCCKNGVFLGVETKAPGKEKNLSKHQQIQQKKILSAGGLYLVVSDAKKLEDWLNQEDRFNGKKS